MTEPQQNKGDASESSDVYSKDYWDNVFEQVGRRPLVKIAFAVLAILYGTAIYAPLVANDRPYYIDSIELKAYSRALKTTYAGSISLRGKAKISEAEFLEKLSEEAPIRTYPEAVENELGAVLNNLKVLRGALAVSDHPPLDELEQLACEVANLAIDGKNQEAIERAGKLKSDAKAIRKSYAAADPNDPESEGKHLLFRESWPLLEATSSLEIFFMWLWLLVLTWPFWNRVINQKFLRSDRDAIRKARRPKRWFVLGSSVLVAIGWALAVGGQATFESADYKLRIMGGETVVRDIVWPPLAMGFAETNGSESFRPPTWSAKAEIDDEGFYVRGARSIRVDERSGVAQTAKPVEIRPAESERNSSFRHLVGTDSNGRDIMARILHGGRISLAVGILSTALLMFLGVIIGATAGYFGGWVDILISRMIEIFQSVPAFFLILTAVTMIPEDSIHPIFAIVFFIAIVRWTGVARLVRAEFFKLKEQEFTVAARALGFSSMRVIFAHILPNAMGPVLVAAAFSVAAGILTESAISFLGLGVKEPIPSWGALLSEARGSTEYWWINLFPGLLIFMTVFCYNIVGEGVRDALDPRRKV